MKEKDSRISLPSSSLCWISSTYEAHLCVCLGSALGAFEMLNLLGFLS